MIGVFRFGMCYFKELGMPAIWYGIRYCPVHKSTFLSLIFSSHSSIVESK